jgi:type VI secretion system protein ImpL
VKNFLKNKIKYILARERREIKLARFNLKRLFRRHSEDAVLHHIESVQNNIHSAVEYLKERLTKPKAFQEMPWYLVIGDKSSGKSQLLLNSNLTFLDKEKFVQLTPDDNETSGGVNWWISPSSVMVDVPGHYIEESESLTPSRAAWLELLNQIRRYRLYKPLNGIIVTIECEQLFNQSGNAEYAAILKSRLLEIIYQLKQQLPVYIVITKLDLIQGFNEYFDDLGKEEREQFCGLTFPLDFKSKLSWTEYYEKQFDALITHLHQRALFRVHQEHKVLKRREILNFPHQLENFREALKKIVYALSTLSPQIFLRGIYLTSSLQETKQEIRKIDVVGSLAKKRFDLVSVNRSPVVKTPKKNSFFIPALFEQKIFSESHLSYSALQGLISPWERLLRWGALGLSVLIIAGSLVFLTHEYHQQTRLLSTARTALSDYKLLSLTYSIEDKTPDITKLLPALDALSLATDNAKRANLPWLLRFQLHFKNSLYDTTKSLYYKQLATRLVPALREKIEVQLQNQNITDTTELYGLLKTYLMLGSPDHFDGVYLKQWFNKNFHDPIMDNADFKKHLFALLNTSREDKGNLSVIPDNTTMVSQTRSALNALPYPLLAQAVFNNHFSSTMTVPFHLENARHSFELPKNFYLDNFAQQNSRQLATRINEALLEAMKGNWILGDKSGQDLTPEKITELQKSQLLDYQARQESLRQEFLSKIKLNTFTQFKELDLSLEELTSKDSPLIQIVNFMQQSDQTKSKHKIQTIPINSIFADLQALNTQVIRPILNSTDPNASALIMAQNIAKQTPQKILFDTLNAHFNPLPEPLRTWLISLMQQSRKLIFVKGLEYTNTIWQSQVYPVCQKKIISHFPFNPNATTDVSLRDFSKFFEKNGILNQFLTIYLSPFIDMSNAKWQWKNVDGLTFSHNTDFLLQLERAEILQSIYFNQKNQLETSFNLTYKNHTNHYIWPLNTQTINNNKDYSNWSIFRMLHQGTLKPLENHQYSVSLNNNIYVLSPDSSINPFIDSVNNISLQFRCPEKL